MSDFDTEEKLKKYACAGTCPIRNVVARFSGKWAMLVLCLLADGDVLRFNAIIKAIPDISPKVLTDTLRGLEADGLVSRTVHAEIPPRVEYSLTGLGRSLMPALNGLIEWAVNNASRMGRRK